MSVVAIKKVGKKFEMAADSIIVSGWTQGKEPNGKMWKIGDLAAGSVGKAALAGLFREYIENHKPKTNNEWGWINHMAEFMKYANAIDNAFKMEDNDFLVAWKGKAFLLCGTFVQEVKKYHAIGAGMDFALAALHLGHSAKEACEIACELSVFCEKPVKVLKA